jgi:hypothetical protein
MTISKMSSDHFKRFNKYTKEFFKELSAMFPDDTSLKLAFQSFKLLKSISKRSPAEYFKDAILSKYGDDIINKNPFFILDTFNCDISFPIILEKIKTIWVVLDKKDQQFVWEHLQVLQVLNNKCFQ